MYRIDKLLKQDQALFHTGDLALLWNTTNKNTLYTTIKRYVQKGILIPVYKGLYSTIPLIRIDPLLIGIKALHRYAYVSGEYVLAAHGIIFQDSPTITLVSSVSRQFTIAGNRYLVRRLTDEYLYNPAGIEQTKSVSVATVPRALADLLYFNPKQHIDNRLLDTQALSKMQKEVGYL